jgi:hypothetical protein
MGIPKVPVRVQNRIFIVLAVCRSGGVLKGARCGTFPDSPTTATQLGFFPGVEFLHDRVSVVKAVGTAQEIANIFIKGLILVVESSIFQIVKVFF